jgi:hypothetical protein
MSYLRFPSRRRMLRMIREGALEAPRFAARTARTMFSQRCSWRVAAEVTRASDLLGYVPNPRDPRSLNEKIIHRKLFAPPAAADRLADKLAVRDHVRDVVGERYLVPLIAVYGSADDIDLATLPRSFVVKASHASGRTLIVHDRDSIDPELLKRKCRSFLSTGFGSRTNEGWYRDIPRRLLVEELLVEDGQPVPLDYKVFVFDGEPGFIQVDFDRFGTHLRSLYTPSWNRMEATLAHEQGPEIAAPAGLGELLDVASRLVGNLDFARVDLYSPRQSGRIYFSEITFAPGAGWERFGPTKDVDFELGRLWRLPPRNAGVALRTTTR